MHTETSSGRRLGGGRRCSTVKWLFAGRGGRRMDGGRAIRFSQGGLRAGVGL